MKRAGFTLIEILIVVGITVFFKEGMSEEEIEALGNQIGEDRRVRRMKFTSAEEAWEKYKKVFCGIGDMLQKWGEW